MNIYTQLQALRAHAKKLRGEMNDMAVKGNDEPEGDMKNLYRQCYRSLRSEHEIVQEQIKALVARIAV